MSTPFVADLQNEHLPNKMPNGKKVVEAVRQLKDKGLVQETESGLEFTEFGSILQHLLPAALKKVREHELFNRHLKEGGGRGLPQSFLSKNLYVFKNGGFRPVRSVDAIGDRESGKVRFQVHELIAISHRLDDAFDGCQDDANGVPVKPFDDDEIAEVLTAVFQVDQIERGPEGRFLSCAASLLEHILGSPIHEPRSPWSQEEIDRIGHVVCAAIHIGGKYEALSREDRQGDFDRDAHNELDAMLRSGRFRDDLLLSEESYHAEDRPGVWYLDDDGIKYRRSANKKFTPATDRYAYSADPVDGSHAYRREQHWATSIGIGRVDDGEFVGFAGVVLLPKTSELFIGSERGGSMLIDLQKIVWKPIFGSKNTTLSTSYLCTHLSASLTNKKHVLDYLHGPLARLAQTYQRIGMWGVGAKSLAYCAAGRIEGFVNVRSGGRWDEDAGIQLVRGARGIVGEYTSRDPGIRQKGIVAAGCKDHYDELLRILKMEP